MLEGVFLEEIKFEKEYPPFKEWTKIYFNDGMRNILEFYLKNKDWFSREDAKSVYERMKINVIVGENGSGKTKLLKSFYYNTKFDEFNLLDANIDLQNLDRLIFSNFSVFDNISNFLKKNYNRKYAKVNLKLPINMIDIQFITDVDRLILSMFLWFGYLSNKYRKKVLEIIFWKKISKIYLQAKHKKEVTFFNNPIYNKWFSLFDRIDRVGKGSEIGQFFVWLWNEENISELELKRYIKSVISFSEKLCSWYLDNFPSSVYKKEKVNNLDFFKKVIIDQIHIFTDYIIIAFLFTLSEGKNEKIFLLTLKKIWVSQEDLDWLKKLKNCKNVTFWNNIIDYCITSLFKEKKFKYKDEQEIIEEIFSKIADIYNSIKKDIITKISIEDLPEVYRNYWRWKDYVLFNKEFLERLEFDLYFKFEKDFIKTYKQFSSGERKMYYEFIYILITLYQLKKDNKSFIIKSFIIFIDEPDLHLHLDWQRQYIQKLIDVFWEFLKENKDISLHFIIATHSPFILSDVPAENVILLQKWKDWYTKVTDWWWNKFNDEKKFKTFEEYKEYMAKQKYNNRTFWANFVDLIRNWFFFQTKNLMWSFAEEVIDGIAEERRQEITNKSQIEKEVIESIESKIWDSFLRDNLLYFKKLNSDDKIKNC